MGENDWKKAAENSASADLNSKTDGSKERICTQVETTFIARFITDVENLRG